MSGIFTKENFAAVAVALAISGLYRWSQGKNLGV